MFFCPTFFVLYLIPKKDFCNRHDSPVLIIFISYLESEFPKKRVLDLITPANF